MVIHNLKVSNALASRSLGSATQLADTVFGVHSCIMTFTETVLNTLPFRLLQSMGYDLLSGINQADSVVKSIYSLLRDTFGIMQWNNRFGRFNYISASSKNGYDRSLGNLAKDMEAFTNGLIQFGQELFATPLIIGQAFEDLKDCIRSYTGYVKNNESNASARLAELSDEDFDTFMNDNYYVERQQLQEALSFITAATNQLNLINKILANRISDPSLEPKFSCSAVDLFTGTNLEYSCLQVGSPTNIGGGDVFRLVYGPPKSTFGQFILSNDGIYFNSQTSAGITPALNEISKSKEKLKNEDKWKFDYAPNLGGRGDSFSIENIKNYINTVLDHNIIDDSEFIQNYYRNDKFLQEITANKNKRIFDLSSQISELVNSSAPESVVYNYRQSLISENSRFLEQINKRKKQIELAVRLPLSYGNRIPYAVGEIPVNDFSYLAGLNMNLDLETQRALSFSQSDIDTVVLPIDLQTIYTVPSVNTKKTSFEHLILTDLADGAIIYDGSSVSATNSVTLASEHFITTDSLIAMYNFLDTSLEDPSSTVYNVRNSVANVVENFAQLVGKSKDFVFKGGLGIPYLYGVTMNSNSTPSQPSSVGSYVKLPNDPKYSDLLYNTNGATIDFWLHAKNLANTQGYDSGNVSGLYRLILANENTGGSLSSSVGSEAAISHFGTRSTRGMIMGFTRDRRLVSNLPASNNSSDNAAALAKFFIAPTQSLNASSVGLINRSYYDTQECSLTSNYLGMTIDLGAIQNCQNEFCHMSVTFDPKKDEIRVYLDGNLLSTSSLSYVFGVEKYQMPNIPTFKLDNSFEYNTTSVGPNAPENLKYGPKLDTYFTPWIVGGGYTDGLYANGNFMGSPYGGIKSGLNGYIGSLKFYSKPLESSEVINNYKAHKNFFKNIDAASLS